MMVITGKSERRPILAAKGTADAAGGHVDHSLARVALMATTTMTRRMTQLSPN